MLTQDHSVMVCRALEIPVHKLIKIHHTFRDECEHAHNTVRKSKFKFCEECGHKRFYVYQEKTDIYYALEDFLVLARVVDPETGNEEVKYYAVMEWYDYNEYDLFLNAGNISKKSKKLQKFIERMKDAKVWKKYRFNLCILRRPIPTSKFYQNNRIKNTGINRKTNEPTLSCGRLYNIDRHINDDHKKEIKKKMPQIKNDDESSYETDEDD